MKLLRPTRIALFLAILASSVLPLASGGALAQSIDWPPAVPGIEGIDYRVFNLPDPVNIFVTRLDRNNLAVTLESSIGSGYIADGSRETVKGMYSRYDGAINYWNKEWGSKNKVAVAINGFFFDPDGMPWSGQIHSTWTAKRAFVNESISGFFWTLNREAFVSQCVFYPADKQRITYLDKNTDQKFHAINSLPAKDQIIIYTPQYAARTPTTTSPRVDVLVELVRPLAIIPNDGSNYVRGIVKEIIPNSSGGILIPFDHIVLSAEGSPVTKLLASVEVGDNIGINQELSASCGHPKYPWTNSYAAIGADKYFLINGVVQTFPGGGDPVVRNARTAVAYDESYIYFIVVDGFDPGISIGLTLPRLGNFIKDTLGASDAVSLDSGGSPTMVVNGNVVNNTTCNFNRCTDSSITDDTNMGIKDGDTIRSEVQPSLEGIWNESSLLVEPLVANGLMMVAVEPSVRFNAFPAGSTAQVFTQTPLRLGPGNNYERLATIDPGEAGSVPVGVLETVNNMNGIFVHGFHWWKVSYGGQEGWAPLDVTQVDFPNQVYLPVIH